jgi:type I restriction enzyme S subunit
MKANLPDWDCQDYTETTWGEIVELRYGKSLKNYKDVQGKYPVYGTNGPVGFCDKTLCGYPSVIIGRKGAYRGVHYSDTPFFVIDTAYFVEPKFDINMRWAYYSLLMSDINGLDSGSAIPSTRREDFYALPALIPPRKRQDEIVRVLDSFNSKIELNRQTNQTLEQIAQAIFKSWFVDFEPTRAKIAAKKRWKALNETTETSSPTCFADEFHSADQQNDWRNISLEEAMTQAAMAAISGKSIDELEQLSPEALQQLKETAALFPDALVESELGEIPEGWEVLGFKDIVKKYIDNRGKTPPISESGIPLLEVKHLPERSIKPDVNTTKYVDEETFNSWFRAHLEKDDLIISTVGTIGRICMVPEGERIAIAQNLLGMRFKREKVSPYFMYYQMDGVRFRHDVDARLVITVQASIKRKDLETIDLLSPPIALQKSFESLVTPIVGMLQSDQEIVLAKIRDALLPKLLSGELTIKSETKERVA